MKGMNDGAHPEFQIGDVPKRRPMAKSRQQPNMPREPKIQDINRIFDKGLRQRTYAKDLSCPEVWQTYTRKHVLPASIVYRGVNDLSE
jgi:hypothetical protein